MSLFGRRFLWAHVGRILKEGTEISVKTVPSAIANGLNLSEDRKSLGLNLLMDIPEKRDALSGLDKISQKLDKEKRSN